MTMGEYIAKLRKGDNKYGKKMTQEELGHALTPPVNRGAVNKWEKGLVENIKRSHIQQIADIFGIKPSELMCFDVDKDALTEEAKARELIQKHFGKSAVQMLEYFTQLNETGKENLLNQACDMCELPKYTD